MANQILYTSNEVYGNRISGPFLQVLLFTSHTHKDSTRGSVHRLISFSLNTYVSLFVHLIVGFQQWFIFRIFYPNRSPCLSLLHRHPSDNSKRYHPPPLPGQPPGKFSNIAKSWSPGLQFWANPKGGFPETLYFNEFYTYLLFSRPQTLIYVPIEYLQILGRT